MLIKEYRIPLPLSLEEYRVAQIYMIDKKSRTETHGAHKDAAEGDPMARTRTRLRATARAGLRLVLCSSFCCAAVAQSMNVEQSARNWI